MPEDKINIPNCPSPTKNDAVNIDGENVGFLDKISDGDLYVLGKLWIDMLKIGLLGTEWSVSVVPVLAAAPANAPTECPQIPSQETAQPPPKMRYKDLPVYTSPHSQYKDAIDRKHICPKAYEKLVHKSVLPHVKSCRLWIRQNCSDFSSEVSSMKREAIGSFRKQYCKLVKYMRDPENLPIRRAVVTFGGLSGCCLGNTTSQKVAFSAAGFLATGALCFPKETDVIFRDVSYAMWRVGNQLANIDCDYKERPSRPCDLNPEPPTRSPNQFCPDMKTKYVKKED